MDNFTPNDYLGKHISDLQKEMALNFNDDSGKSFRIFDTNTKYLFGQTVTDTFVKTNNHNIVVSVSTYYRNDLKEEVYKAMIKTYGEPKSILKEDVKTEQKEFVLENWGTVVSKSYSLKHVSHSEVPILIVWQNKDVQIVVTNNPKNNSLKILFTQTALNTES